MRKKLLFIGFTVLIIIVLGGWLLMKMSERPAALKDSLTASHLDKESRTSDGFFRYTSKKNEYSMFFPEKYVIDRETFQERKEFESWRMLSKENDEKALIRSIKILYNNNDSIPDAFFERYSFEGKFEKVTLTDSNGNEIYIGYVNNYFDENAKLIKRDPAKYGPTLVISLIKDPDTGKTIKIHSSTVCPKNSTCQKVSLKSEKEFILKIAKSVKF
ncbi:hypothetical protein [Rossellomorea marisflavi]|uniref:hypothetical protein n=1 Tax=Rossellomorea marisflavi TaxID=189381 RepID=UPI001EE35940|nr:hypothetical protein [Rossellomorea marisflavi]UKS65221.1 hypothetical protein K6T23_21300 [Rossellomorea marisflavi]